MDRNLNRIDSNDDANDGKYMKDALALLIPIGLGLGAVSTIKSKLKHTVVNKTKNEIKKDVEKNVTNKVHEEVINKSIDNTEKELNKSAEEITDSNIKINDHTPKPEQVISKPTKEQDLESLNDTGNKEINDEKIKQANEFNKKSKE